MSSPKPWAPPRAASETAFSADRPHSGQNRMDASFTQSGESRRTQPNGHAGVVNSSHDDPRYSDPAFEASHESALGRGQQAYVRAGTSSNQPRGSSASDTSSPPTLTFPSAFGTRQRVAMKSSRPQPGPTVSKPGNWLPRRQSDNDASSRRVPSASGPPPALNVATSPANLSGVPPITYASQSPRLPSDGRLSPHRLVYEWDRPQKGKQTERSTPSTTRDSLLDSPHDSVDWHTANGDEESSSHHSTKANQDRSRPPSPLLPSSSASDRLESRSNPRQPASSQKHLSQASRKSPRERSVSPTPGSYTPHDSRSRTPDPNYHSTFQTNPPSSSHRSPAESPSSARDAEPPTRTSSMNVDRGDEEYSYRPGEQGTFGSGTARNAREHGGSVMDRPRPKTPESGAMFAFGGGGGGGWGTLPTMNQSTRPQTPDAGSMFSFSVAADQPSSKIQSTSVLDRPRPKTPEPQSWLDQSTRGAGPRPARPFGERQTSWSRAPHDAPAYESKIPLSSPSMVSRTFPHSTSQQSSLSQLSASSSGLGGASGYRRSSDSVTSDRVELDGGGQHAASRSRFASVGSGPPPTLKLDLDFEPSETMFDLASLLNVGSSSVDTSITEQKRRHSPPHQLSSTMTAQASTDQRHSSPRQSGSRTAEQPSDDGDKTPLASTTTRFSLAVSLEPALAPAFMPAPTPVPAPKKRRKSLSSLLSLGSSSNDHAQRLPSQTSSDSLARTSHDSATRPSIDSYSKRSVSHEPSLSTSTMASQMSQTTQPTSTSSSTGTKRPSTDQFTLDKSLPPTPPGPPLGSKSESPAAADPSDSPTKGALSRQLSKFRNRNQNQSSKPSSGFQLISATTTKKLTGTKTRNESVSSTDGTGGPPSSQTSPFGRRLVERFGANKLPASVAPLNADATQISPTKKPRRNSLSNLLGGGSGDGRPFLGMSLAAGRRSADLLSSTTKPMYDQDAPSAAGKGFSGRRSLDLLSDRPAMSRWPSSDRLKSFNLAKVGPISPPVISAPVVAIDEPAIQPLVLPEPDAEAPYDSEPQSFPSTPTSAVSQESAEAAFEPASVETATRVVRSESSSSVESAAANSPHLTTPRLMQSNTLRSGSMASAPMDGFENRSDDTPRVDQPPAFVGRTENVPPVVQKRATSMSSAWLEIEGALAEYTSALAEDRQDRGPIVANTLLPFLRREEDSPEPLPVDSVAKRQRGLLFSWLSTLTDELRLLQPTHRGACLEAVAAISESHFLSPAVLEQDAEDKAEYRSAIVDVLAFAIEKLNDKAVYANTLVFSGRILALAFFRIEGVGIKLLRALPAVKRQFIKRVLDEAGIDERRLPHVDLRLFPAHLWSLCLRDLPAYNAMLLSSGPGARPQGDGESYLVKDGDVSVEMTGNWLIRWTASDSDLPFAFYRAYHRQLAAHLVPTEARRYIGNQALLEPSAVLVAPGALFIAASLLEKSDALVHRNLRSVTSIGPNNSNFNTNDSANLSFGQKPKILELANRRVVQTMLDIVGGPPLIPGDAADAPPDADIRRHAFSRMLQVWIRACIKRTSLWDTRSVFILLDLIEALLYTLSFPAPSARNSDQEINVPKPSEACIEMFDVSFIFNAVKIILSSADNTVTLMRTIAFIYAHFEIFTLRPQDRDELCDNIILDEKLFVRLYLHWNAGVRGYFIRLLVWRLSRLGIVDAEQHPDQPRDPRILAIFSTMNIRLEAIRKRHDELEPVDNLTDDSFFKPKRSTICSTRGVKEAPFAVDQLVGGVLEQSDEDDMGSDNEEEPQELVRTAPNGAPLSKKNGVKDVPTMVRVVSWLKGGVGRKKGSEKAKRNLPSSKVEPFDLSIPPSPSQALDEPQGETHHLSKQDPVDTSWPTQELTPAPTPINAPDTDDNHLDKMSQRKANRRSRIAASPSFFAFDFENGLGPPPGAEERETSDAASVQSNGTADTMMPVSPIRRSFSDQKNAALSPRVSVRFSKRISILPPAALDLFKESGEAVPVIPDRFRQTPLPSYESRLHPYAIRGLRDYEDALDEWTEWAARLQDEEDGGVKHSKGFVDFVPRLAVSWPASFEE